MCGRYYIATEQEDSEIRAIIEQVNKRYHDTPELSAMKTGEIYPTNIVPALTADSPLLMKWGFSRYDGKGQIINARLETAAEKPTFRKSFFEQRCLIPASHYFEWNTTSAGKQKYALGLRATLYMAGLYRYEKNTSVPQFVILTRSAAENISFIHDRMPVILPKDVHEAWLGNRLDSLVTLNQSVEDLVYDGDNYQPSLF